MEKEVYINLCLKLSNVVCNECCGRSLWMELHTTGAASNAAMEGAQLAHQTT